MSCVCVCVCVCACVYVCVCSFAYGCTCRPLTRFYVSYLQKRAKAQALLEKVFEHLELIEKDFFGLQYADLVPAPDAMVTVILLLFQLLVLDPEVRKRFPTNCRS